jgi:protein-tyrosine phosphatase
MVVAHASMIDLHCHMLAGIDDGPATIEASLELARSALEVGIGTVVATPHVNARTPNDAATIARLVRELNERLAAAGLELEVLPGAEIAITQLGEIEPRELERLTLGGGRWLLVEPPFALVAPGLREMVVKLVRDGHGVVLAHPERCPALHRDHSVVRELVEAGVLMSITAGSLVGRFGGEVRRYALELAREQLIHNVTSDAHDSVKRPPGLAEELQQAGLGALREWLTEAVPGAILAGEPIPSRPAGASVRARRRWTLRRA